MSELDSHTNMICMVNQVTIIQDTGQYANVNSFSEDIGMMPRVPIVDAVISYDCLHSNQTFLLITRNDLHIKSMDHNLIATFILFEAG